MFGKVQKGSRVFMTYNGHTHTYIFQLLLRLSHESRRRDCNFVAHHNSRECSKCVCKGSIGHFRAPFPVRSILSAVEKQNCQLLWKASWSSSNPLAERIYASSTSAEPHHRAKSYNHSYNYRWVTQNTTLILPYYP